MERGVFPEGYVVKCMCGEVYPVEQMEAHRAKHKAKDEKEKKLRESVMWKAENFAKEMAKGRRDFRNSDFENVSLSGLNLSGCDFRGSNFHNALLFGCDLSHTDFRNCKGFGYPQTAGCLGSKSYVNGQDTMLT